MGLAATVEEWPAYIGGGSAPIHPVPSAGVVIAPPFPIRGRDESEAAFAEVNRQLERQGLVVKAGTLVDATLIPAAAAEPPKQKGGGRSKVDPDAAWAKRAKGGAHFG